MEDQTARQLTRQLKLLNFWITLFGTIIIIAFITIIVLLYQVYSFTQNTSRRIDDIQESTRNTLDFRSKVCETDRLGGLLQDRSEICRNE